MDPNDTPADPTVNVNALVQAGTKRQDDLAEAERRRVNEVIALRAEYAEKLSLAEAKRIDAIRAVDVNAVAVASERAAAQATVLANQVSASAETLRTLVAATATTIAQQLASITSQLTDRISALEKSSYTDLGREKNADPLLQDLFREVKLLRQKQDSSTGSGEGRSSLVGWIIGGVGFLATLIGIFSYFR